MVGPRWSSARQEHLQRVYDVAKSATSETESRQASSLNAELKLELVARVLAQYEHHQADCEWTCATHISPRSLTPEATGKPPRASEGVEVKSATKTYDIVATSER